MREIILSDIPGLLFAAIFGSLGFEVSCEMTQISRDETLCCLLHVG